MKNLNTTSKKILLIGLLAFVVSGVLLPWKNKNEPLGYGFIWAPAAKEYTIDIHANAGGIASHSESNRVNDLPPPPPGFNQDLWRPQTKGLKPQLIRDSKGVVVDTTRLFIQWAVILAVTAAGIVFAQLAGGRKDSGV